MKEKAKGQEPSKKEKGLPVQGFHVSRSTFRVQEFQGFTFRVQGVVVCSKKRASE
jgi:hypothetical protein